MFEAANAALAQEKWAEAAAGVRGAGAARGHERADAVDRAGAARVGLLELRQIDAAEAALRSGFPGLPADDKSLSEDRYLALFTLGQIEAYRLDSCGRAGDVRQGAAAGAVRTERAVVLLQLASVTMFDAPAEALAQPTRRWRSACG
jgi:hypothetical protein